MIEELEMIETLKELRSLYQSDDLREIDFDVAIFRLEQKVKAFEKDLEEQYAALSFMQEHSYVPEKEI